MYTNGCEATEKRNVTSFGTHGINLTSYHNYTGDGQKYQPIDLL